MAGDVIDGRERVQGLRFGRRGGGIIANRIVLAICCDHQYRLIPSGDVAEWLKAAVC